MSQKLEDIFSRLHQKTGLGLVLLGEGGVSEFPFELVSKLISDLTFVAEGPKSENAIREKLHDATVFRRDDQACIDHLKIRSDGRGYDIVIVWDSAPAAVRMALGAAAVLGEVLLYFSPRGKVSADLHSTINYKSLRVSTGVSE